jgi:hypothetical protein
LLKIIERARDVVASSAPLSCPMVIGRPVQTGRDDA